MTKATLPTLAVGDAVVIIIAGGAQQSAILTHFESPSCGREARAIFAWKTGPGRYDTKTSSIPSSMWKTRIIAVFPKDAKFLAV